MKIYKDLKSQLQKKGINIINTDYYNLIEVWKSWYAGNVDNFHFYNVKLADGTTKRCERKTMNMAKKSCEDMSRLLWSNNCKIKLGTPEKTKKLWEILNSKQNNFSIMIPKMIELSSALGTVAFTEYIDNLGKVRIEYIGDSSMIIPYKYDNANITGMVVLNQWTQTEGKKVYYYTHLTYHEFEEKLVKGVKQQKYIKYNELYKSKDDTQLGKEIPFETIFPDIQNPVEYDTSIPHFQILRPNIVNNYDIEIPMGISIFANSIDKLKAIDIKYDSFSNEFIQGKKRILLDKSAIKASPQVNADGTISATAYIDKNDTTYVAINGMDNQPVKDIDFNIRYNEHIDSINAELNYFASSLGFGENFYKYDGASTKTATEVKAENSDAYRTKDSYSIILDDVIVDLVKSVCFLGNIDIKENEIQVEFDWSRFKDDIAEQTRLMQEVNAGITSKVEYREKVYNETEEVAMQKIQQAQEQNPTVKDLIGE